MSKMLIFNSFAPVRLNWMFRWVILKLKLMLVGWSISCEIDLRWISLDLTVSMEGNGLVPSGNPFWIFIVFIRTSLDGTYYGMALSVRPSVRPSVRSSVRPTVSTKKHRCKWRIFFKFCTQVCLGVPSINLLFVLSYLIKYVHNSIISDFSIFGIHRVIF